VEPHPVYMSEGKLSKYWSMCNIAFGPTSSGLIPEKVIVYPSVSNSIISEVGLPSESVLLGRRSDDHRLKFSH